jgi:hypothetical protein
MGDGILAPYSEAVSKSKFGAENWLEYVIGISRFPWHEASQE